MAVCNGEPVPWDEARAVMLLGSMCHASHPITLINPLPVPGLLVIVLGMADVLHKIKQAEQDAEKQLAHAQAETAKIADDARRQSVQIITDATDGSVSDTQTSLDAARAEANAEASSVLSAGQKVVDGIESSAAERKDKAVAHLLTVVTSQ